MKTLSFILSKMDNTLKKVIKRQIPYLIGGAITGAFLAYYFGFLASFVVNTIVWTGVSILVNKLYFKSDGFDDQKYLINYARSIIVSYKRK